MLPAIPVPLRRSRTRVGATKKRIDAEADMGAAELLFQGDLFVRMALGRCAQAQSRV
jgi:hypothetical protein